MKIGDRLLMVLLPLPASLLIRLIHGLMRIEYLDENIPRRCWDRGEHLLMPFWHDQLLLMSFGYRGPGCKTLISASKDGELIARVIRYFGYQAVRGSSSRGGRSAFREMLRLAKEKTDLVFTPDGPRGPRHELKDGIVQLARLSGRMVVPMAFACSRGYRFRSWDRFLLPYPFSRGVYAFGEPIGYEQNESIEDFRLRLERSMSLTQQKAIKRLEEQGVSAV